jgi:hypothetical protein
MMKCGSQGIERECGDRKRNYEGRRRMREGVGLKPITSKSNGVKSYLA